MLKNFKNKNNFCFNIEYYENVILKMIYSLKYFFKCWKLLKFELIFSNCEFIKDLLNKFCERE